VQVRRKGTIVAAASETQLVHLPDFDLILINIIFYALEPTSWGPPSCSTVLLYILTIKLYTILVCYLDSNLLSILQISLPLFSNSLRLLHYLTVVLII